jgi:hypothetical protein
LAWVTRVKSLSGSVFAFERRGSRDRRTAKDVGGTATDADLEA